jgi:DNA-binding winged helix-turn-helix (wHTH) protein
MNAPSKIYEFGSFILDEFQHRLECDNAYRQLTPKMFELLVMLVENRRRAVSKEELLNKIWDAQSVRVEVGTLYHHISELRRVLREDKSRPQFIRTISKKGYQFIAPVKELPTINLPTARSATGAHDLKIPRESFGEWLEVSVIAQKLPRALYTERSLLKMGECTVLRTALDPSGYEEIVMEQQQQTEDLKLGIAIGDHSQWETELKTLETKRVSGISGRVTQFLPELTDDLKARVKYQTVGYAEARAFHEVLQNDVSLVPNYREAALQVLSNGGTDVPNILATAIVAIIGSDAKKPELVLANRMGRIGGYHGNCWAVSIGEQYMPITGMRRGRIVEADGSIFVSAERGLREEILSDNYTGSLRLSVHAFVLEDYINNFFFLAIADLRPLTFGELKQLWRKSVDSFEHNAIAALPLSRQMLMDCMEEDGLPESCWSAIQEAGTVEVQPGLRIAPKMHRWQPNSHVRLAGCMWYLNDELT